ncbi:hypothetical protein EKI60_05495 [Candidatus Saccharibacteria bacterium]|nr:MAG: hypothetical protein EKI60_05495 [Candidatus Saccharibacteria bacterium]
MSIRADISSEFRFFRDHISPMMQPVYKAAALFFSGDLMELISDIHLERDVLPEPIDIPDHIGNTREAAMATVACAAMVIIPRMFQYAVPGLSEKFRKSSSRAAAGAFAVSSLIQVVGEKFEISNSPTEPNVGDALDAAYGIGWSAVVAVGAYKVAVDQERQHVALSQETFENYMGRNGPNKIPAQIPIEIT